MDIQLSGSVTSIEAAFNVSLGMYQHPTENRTFYAPDREPTMGLPFPVWHISGLDNFSLPHAALIHKSQAQTSTPLATTGSGPLASYLGSDMRAAYYGGRSPALGSMLLSLSFMATTRPTSTPISLTQNRPTACRSSASPPMEAASPALKAADAMTPNRFST